MTKYSYLILLILFFSIAVNAQTKDEKETRITSKDFPEVALQFLSQLPENTKRIKYYKETDGDKTSFEAKFKLKKNHYSIEFDVYGRLEDIEVLKKMKTLNSNVQNGIKNYFNKTYSKYSIIRLQKQYKNTTDFNLNILLQKALTNATYNAIFYELVAEVRLNKKREILELTFDSKGHHLSSRILKPSSYEHVLY